MKLKETIDEFLESVSENSTKIYITKIYSFHKFLVEVKGISDGSFESYLSSMRIEEVIDSLDYYINKNQIAKSTVAWHYISVVKRYFSFLEIKGISNNGLLKLFGLDNNSEKSFNNRIKKVIDGHEKLFKLDSKEELNYDEIEMLVIECDEQIRNILMEKEKVLDYNKYASKYNDLMYSIVIKLIVFSGIKYKVIGSIKVKDIDLNHNRISINGYIVHLPNNLSDQLREYIDIRGKLNAKDDSLFVDVNGESIGTNTSLLTSRLQSYIGRMDTTGMIKYTVIEMINKGINQSLIQSFTSVGDEIFKYCQNRVNGDKNRHANRYLDSKLISMKINDIL